MSAKKNVEVSQIQDQQNTVSVMSPCLLVVFFILTFSCTVLYSFLGETGEDVGKEKWEKT